MKVCNENKLATHATILKCKHRTHALSLRLICNFERITDIQMSTCKGSVSPNPPTVYIDARAAYYANTYISIHKGIAVQVLLSV